MTVSDCASVSTADPVTVSAPVPVMPKIARAPPLTLLSVTAMFTVASFDFSSSTPAAYVAVAPPIVPAEEPVTVPIARIAARRLSRSVSMVSLSEYATVVDSVLAPSVAVMVRVPAAVTPISASVAVLAAPPVPASTPATMVSVPAVVMPRSSRVVVPDAVLLRVPVAPLKSWSTTPVPAVAAVS
ncbi:MAG: hypothetical protein EB033_15345, partial [Proteobacteria bacterium]|nr:hypothetical protein [Pseudomonadota bacterium]